jgi:hypothetical protein
MSAASAFAAGVAVAVEMDAANHQEDNNDDRNDDDTVAADAADYLEQHCHDDRAG